MARPAALRRGAVVLYGLVLACALVTAARTTSQWIEHRSNLAPARVVAADSGIVAVRVLEPPDPMPWGIAWEDPPEIGTVVQVELYGPCRCQPRRSSPPSLVPLILAAVSAAWAGWCLVTSTLAARRSRAAHARSLGLVGVAPWQPVDLRIQWGASRMPFVHVAPLDGRAPVTARLVRPTRELDPTVPFVAWGDPEPGATIALTSTDGMQLLPLDEPVRRAEASPPVDPEITGAVAATLGWPPAASDGADDRVAAIDRAVDDARLRWRPTGAAVGLGVALVLVLGIAGRSGLWSVPALAILLVVYARGQRWAVEPIDEAVRRIGAAPAAPLRRRVVRAVSGHALDVPHRNRARRLTRRADSPSVRSRASKISALRRAAARVATSRPSSVSTARVVRPSVGCGSRVT